MKTVTYKGESAYIVVGDQTYRRDVPENVSDEAAEAARKVEGEKFDFGSGQKDDSGD